MTRVLIIAPNWVGDVALAVPAIRAIRTASPRAHLAVLVRRSVAGVLAGLDWIDELIEWPTRPDGRPMGVWRLASRLRSGRFDTAILMPNSFRAAMLSFLARIGRRVGYARGGRTLLLTHPIRAIKQGRRFVAESMLTYYARLADAVGCPVADPRLELATRADDRRAIDELLADSGGPPGRSGPSGPLLVLNPGGAFGPSKYWPAERFGQLADRLVERFGGRVVVSGAPGEREIVERVAAAMRGPAVRLTDNPVPLSAVKELVRRADLLVTNDTGPRHFAIAFGTPVVTLFGSTDPAWTETRCPWERQVRIDLPCSPCQRKVCPLGHHDCMRMMTVQTVEQVVLELWDATRSAGRPHGS